MANETTTKFKVDISDLKKGIQEANRQIKLANAEFKAAASGMDNWGKSADGISKKIESLKTILGSQEKILGSYKKQLELITKEYGENSKEADEMRIKIANQQTAINNTQAEIRKYSEALEDLKENQSDSAKEAEKQLNSYETLQKVIGEQEETLRSLKDEYKNVVLEQGKDSDAAKDLAKQIADLTDELDDNQKQMKDLDEIAGDLDDTIEETSGGFTVMKGALAELVADGIEKAIGAMKDFVKSTIETGMAFDAMMSEVAAISGATGDDLELLRETAKQYGSTTVFSATEAAEALKYMSLAGWDAQTSSEALEGVLNLAAASGMDLADASDLVTDYLSAFGLEAKDSAYFADLLAYAQSKSNTWSLSSFRPISSSRINAAVTSASVMLLRMKGNSLM